MIVLLYLDWLETHPFLNFLCRHFKFVDNFVVDVFHAGYLAVPKNTEHAKIGDYLFCSVNFCRLDEISTYADGGTKFIATNLIHNSMIIGGPEDFRFANKHEIFERKCFL